MHYESFDISASRGELMRYVSRHVREISLSEDIVQEAYLRYLAYSQKTGTRISNPLSFLRRISINLARDHFRRDKRFSTVELDENTACEHSDIQRQLEHRELVEIVSRVLAKMPVLRRKVFVSRRVHGLSSKEAAGEFGLTPGAVDMHVARAVLDLHRAMELIEKRADV